MIVVTGAAGFIGSVMAGRLNTERYKDLVLVDDFSSDDWTVPLYRLMWQLRSNSFWIRNKQQMIAMLRESGFRAIRSRRIYNYTWLITGRKGLTLKPRASRT